MKPPVDESWIECRPWRGLREKVPKTPAIAVRPGGFGWESELELVSIRIEVACRPAALVVLGSAQRALELVMGGRLAAAVWRQSPRSDHRSRHPFSVERVGGWAAAAVRPIAEPPKRRSMD